MNFHDLNNYNLADAVKFHQRLNPGLWGKDEHLLPEVKEKLLSIAEFFQEFLGVDNLKVKDITVSGSNAAYSYTKNSDIDLHLVVDMPDDPVYQELFNAKKYEFNDTHNIKIAGVPVELYVQPSDQKHVSQGIYSVKNGDWVQVPQRRRASIDDSCVQHKTADLDARIHSAIKTGNADAVNQLWHKIKTMRQTGLDNNGEFGCENIVFKLLRNMGCIGRLKDAKTAIQDRELSLPRKPAARKKVNYGMRDYWYPGTAYAGQDHPAGTESEQVDESLDTNHLKKILHRFYHSCVDKLQLENPPKLRLETTSDWSQENGSFGQYDADTNTLILATAGRHVLDILRTMAHEMTHRQQDETNPLPIDAGATGSPWEDQANAMAGRIMRDWAEEQPEMFDGVTLEEASGYIPTKAQARDPRFVMALTRDVRPGAVGREANKLGLKTDSQGHPALLTAGLNKLLREFKEKDLFEINMGGKSLRAEAAKTGAIAGMEFEMIVPAGDRDESNDELEPDYDQDRRCRSIDDAVDFFMDGEYNGSREVRDLREKMENDFLEWRDEKIGDDWDNQSEEYIAEWVGNNVDESEWNPDDLEDRARNQALEAYAVDVNANPDSDYYQAAYEEFREERQDDWDESDWLDAQDLDTMQGIENAYMITWPYWINPNEGNGSVNTKMVADEFSQAVGRQVRVNTRYHQSGDRPGPRNQFYVVEPDGSLQGDNDGDEGLEFVSPPMPIDELLKDLNAVKSWAGRMGVYTNKSTGLHINISVPNYSIDNLDFVKLALLLGDKYVLEQFGRSSNTYTKSALDLVKNNVRTDPASAQQLLEKMKGNLGQLASKAIHSGVTSKYTSINTKDGHIEFRSPGGDWLDENFDQIENTLLRFTVAMSAALNPEAYREEYLKKLYKLLTENNKDESDTIRYFSEYVAGKIPRTALRSFVKQAQLQRQVKRNSKQPMWWRVDKEGRGGMASIEVVATSSQEAIDKAANEWGLFSREYKSQMTATPIRPYDGSQADQVRWPGSTDQTDMNNRLGLGSQSADANYEIVDRRTNRPVFLFIANTPAEAARKFDDWLDSAFDWSDPSTSARNYIYRPRGASQPAQPAALTLGGRPSNPDGNWLIMDRNRRPVYRFMAASTRDAETVWLQWSREHAGTWQLRHDPELELSQSPQAAVAGRTQDPQQSQAQGDFSGVWKIVDSADREVHRFYSASNSQTDANRVAVQWLADNREPNESYTVLPIMRTIDIPAANTQWEVYNRSSNQPVFAMQATNQAEAWRRGQEWVATAMQADPEVDASNFSVRPRAQSVSQNIAMLEQRLRRDLDALGNQEPTGPETPPKMPAGTIKVDVSDMYDWYKLGQHISNLKGIDKRTLGTGPPHTVFAFGSEELENKYSHELTNLGLKTHDLDEPGEEDMDESREITKLGKLDNVLKKCMNMIHRGQESNPEKYGRVAACLIDNKNNHTYGINLPGPDGTRRHAERVAIHNHLKRHGRIGPNAIMVTTLSPCVHDMDERHGESCTDLLADYGIEKCYAGWQDPTQHPVTDYPFNLQVTDNADIFNSCRDIAASFLPGAMVEGSMKDLYTDLQDQQWDGVVGHVINGLKKGMDIGRMELNLYKWASNELFDVDQTLEDHGFANVADLADHIQKHGGRYVPPTFDFDDDQDVEKGLYEAVTDNYLYHATQPAGMMRILRSGVIKASYRPQDATKAKTQYPTVSTTRSKQYAESDDFVDFLNLTREGNSVIIVFDKSKIANHYRMFSTSQGTQTVGDEFEEVIVVPKGSMPIQGTMKGFYFNPNREQEIEEFQDAPWFKELLTSPYYMGQKQHVVKREMDELSGEKYTRLQHESK